MKEFQNMRAVSILLFNAIFVFPLFSAEGISVTFEPGEAKGKTLVIARAANTSTKPIQAVVFKMSPRSGKGLSGVSTQVLGLSEESRLLQSGEIRDFNLFLPSGLDPAGLSISVDCIYYADGTATGPGKDQHAPQIRGMIAGVIAERSKSSRQ